MESISSMLNVYCGPALNPGAQQHYWRAIANTGGTRSRVEGLKKLAQYIIRAPLSQERLLYIPASEVPHK